MIPTMLMRLALPAAFCLALAVAPLPAAADAVIGAPAPDFAGIDSNGKTVKLSDYRGKVVVLDFWGDW